MRAGDPTAPATIAGVPKIPAPMIRPTMIAVASPSERTCAGPEGECGDFSGVGIREPGIGSCWSCAGADRRGNLRGQVEEPLRGARARLQVRPPDARPASPEREGDEVVLLFGEQQRRAAAEALRYAPAMGLDALVV